MSSELSFGTFTDLSPRFMESLRLKRFVKNRTSTNVNNGGEALAVCAKETVSGGRKPQLILNWKKGQFKMVIKPSDNQIAKAVARRRVIRRQKRVEYINLLKTKVYTFEKLEKCLSIWQKNGHKFLSKTHADVARRCVKYHAKEVRAKIESLRIYEGRGSLPLKSLRQMVAAARRQSERRWRHSLLLRKQKTGKYANIYRWLEVEEPQIKWTCAEETAGPASLKKPKIKTFVGLEDKNQQRPIVIGCENQTMHDVLGECASMRRRIGWATSNERWSYLTIIGKYFANIAEQMPAIIYRNCARVIAQADNEDAHGSTFVNDATAGNTIVTAGKDASRAGGVRIGRWKNYVSEDVNGSYQTMTDRYIPWKTFAWSNAHARDTELLSVDLPVGIVSDTRMEGQPLLQPFRVNSYWHGDMEIRVQCNANKFQVGQLQVAWYYGAFYDASMDQRANIYNLSQCMHGIIDAASCNEVVLRIPYRSHLPMLPINKRAENSTYLNLGRLYVRVLSPLVVPDSAPNTANLTVIVSFPSGEFTGMRSATVKPQMEPLLIDGAMRLINTAASAYNMDNPPAVVPPAFIVPTASHSWSIGTDLAEPLHALRLSSAGQVQFPGLLGGDQHPNVSDVVSIFGLFDSYYWDRTQYSGSQLWSWNMDPNVGVLSGYVIKKPPISVLSSCFAYWRGSIELRFDFVSSQFHNGRLLIAYIPAADKTVSVTMDEARASMYTIYDLQERKTCSFVVPYISDNIWQHRTSGMSGERTSHPILGSVRVYILNPLVCPETVSSKIDVLVYIRGGDSFELSVPIQPSLGLCFDTNIITPRDDLVQPTPGYSPIFTGTWNEYPDLLVFRWGTLPGRQAQFDNAAHALARRDAFYFSYRNNDLYYYAKDSTGAIIVKLVYYAMFFKYTDGKYYGCVVEGLEKAKQAVFAYQSGTDWQKYCKITYIKDGDYTTKSVIFDVKAISSLGEEMVVIERDGVMVQGEREESEIPLDVTNDLVSTNYGMHVFGESFNRLKDLCRRYQFYAQYSFSSNSLISGNFAVFQFPTLPQGIYSNPSVDYDARGNKCRDGMLPIIASGFKYYRGSIRYRLIFDMDEKINVWIQHRPEQYMGKLQVQNTRDNDLGVLAHGYAMYIQSLSVNNVIEFEVPFYQRGLYGLLGKPSSIMTSDYMHFGNGRIVVGVLVNELVTTKKLQSRCDIYYSIGDDMEFNTFQGFPPMVDATSIIIEPGRPASDIRVQPQGFLDGFKKTSDNLENVQRNTEAIATRLSEIVDQMGGEIKSKFNLTDFTHILMTNLAHVVAAGNTIKSWGVAILSFLSYMGLKTISASKTALETVIRVLRAFCPDSHEELLEQDTKPVLVKSQGDNDDVVYAWFTLLYTSVLSIFGLKNGVSQRNVLKFFTKDMGDIVRTSNSIFLFIKNHIMIIKRMFRYVLGLSSPELGFADMFSDPTQMGALWIDEVNALTKPTTREENMGEDEYTEQVWAAQLRGQLIIREMANINLGDSRITAMIQKAYDQITSLQNDCIVMGKTPFTRRMPFVITIEGEPGVGKTGMIHSLTTGLLSAADVKVPTNHTCMINCASSYWDQCVNQPIIVLDDAFAIQTGQMLESQLATIFGLVSDAPFTPPMADLRDKRRRICPEIFLMTTNHPFYAPVNAEAKALHRRRNVLIKAKRAPVNPMSPKHSGCAHCYGGGIRETAEIYLRDFHHLVFNIYGDVTDPNSVIKTDLTYEELFDLVRLRFLDFRKNQIDMFTRKVMEISVLNSGEPTPSKMEYDSILSARKRMYEQYSLRRTRTLFSDIQDCSKTVWNYLMQFTTKEIVEETDYMKIFEQCTIYNPRKHTNIKEYLELYNKAKPQGDEIMVFEESLWGFASIEQALGTRSDKTSVEHEFMFIVIDFLKQSDTGMSLLSKCNQQFLKCNFKLKVDSILDIIVEEFKNKICCHCTETFMECEFERDHFILPNGACVSEDFRCKNFCIANCDPLYRCLLQRWKQHNNPRFMHIVNGNIWRTPKLLRPIPDRRRNILIILQEWCEKVWVNALNLLSENKTAHYAWETICKICKFVNSALFNIALLAPITTLFTGWMGYKMYSGISKKIKPQKHTYEERITRVARTAPRIGAKAQGNSQQAEYVEGLIRKNMVILRVRGTGELVGRVWNFVCICLGDRNILALRHYLDVIDRYSNSVTLSLAYAERHDSRLKVLDGVEMLYENLHRQEYFYDEGKIDSNFVVFQAPARFQPMRNLMKFIASGQEHTYISQKCMFIRPNQLATEVCVETRNMPVIIEPACEGAAEVHLVEVYKYPKMQREGFCGSIIICPTLQCPIIGMHVAGHSEGMGYGIAEPLVKEMFLEVEVNSSVRDVVDMRLESVDLAAIDLETAIYPHGTVPSSMAVAQSDRSQFVPSLIHGTLPVETRPMPLGKNDPRMNGQDPMKLGCEKHGLVSREFEDSLVYQCRDDFKKIILHHAKPLTQNVGVLDLQTATCGDPKIPEFSALVWSSSEGFPLIKSRPNGVRGKGYLFNRTLTPDGWRLDSCDPEFMRLLSVETEMRKRGIRPNTIFTDCLKDELRPLEKANTPGKTRVFSTAPVNYVVAYRQYFGDFMAAMRRARLSCEHGIGINVNGSQWTELAQHLQQRGTAIIAGDYSHFGYTLSNQMMRAVFEIQFAWYAKNSNSPTLAEDQRVRRVLASEILNNKHLCFNLIYQVQCGMPSGFPATDVMNSMINSLYIRAVWIKIMNTGLYSMHKHCVIVTYGDDVCINVSDEVKEKFNAVTMQKAFASWDIKFTDIDKTGKVIPFRNLATAPFLKRNFMPHPTRKMEYLAPLPVESIQSVTNWIHRQDDKRNNLEATVVNCKQALELAYGRGPKYYNELAEVITQALSKHDYLFMYPEWEEVDSRVFDQGYSLFQDNWT
uniref:Genome polyprotein n=1 Tax=Erysiphe necator associated picorna-like virus 1 TaxID=2695357 RepID=A0A7U3RD33_9VIRU|nr:RdRp [Erysiphe necator associated picorna-like virus 1]